ncbi:MAG: class I SAM-dependent methyltransferase [bacterium]
MEIVCPVDKTNNTILIKEIDPSVVVDLYKQQLKNDIVFPTIKNNKIQLFRCVQCGYEFYYPFNLSGDDFFYQELEKLPWYYSDWKWEYSVVEKIIKENDSVLEIGCGAGKFIEKIKIKGANIEGLELNSNAVKKCKEKNLSVYLDSIEEFSQKKPLFYNVVCSFQVLEHINNVKSFLESSLKILKPGGLMIISVPNNDSFIFKQNNLCLNMPPHHMGLWNINSLIKLQDSFNIKLRNIFLEPTQREHLGFTEKIIEKKIIEKMKQKHIPILSFIKKIFVRLTNLGVSSVSEYIPGHTIIAIFKKNE